jgi:hypothetical protein
MKPKITTIRKTIILFVTLITISSCSNDDDAQATVNQDYFPTKIETINPTDPNSNGTLNIVYNNQNKISQLTYLNGPNTIALDITYSTDNNITQIKSTKTTPTVNSVANFIFTYTNNYISQIILSTTTDVASIDISYDPSTKTYTLGNDTSLTNYFTYDADGNLKELDYALNLSLNYNGQNGIYKGIDNSFPIFFASLLSGLEGTLTYSQFFSNKELTSIQFSSGTLSTIVTRDSNNNISQVAYKNAATEEISFTSTVEYQLRNTN